MDEEVMTLTIDLKGGKTIAAVLRAIADIEEAAALPGTAEAPCDAPRTPGYGPHPKPAELALREPEDEPQLRVPRVGGTMRAPIGGISDELAGAPETPTGPGFEEAPDISNTGNYFTTGNYDNA